MREVTGAARNTIKINMDWGMGGETGADFELKTEDGQTKVELVVAIVELSLNFLDN